PDALVVCVPNFSEGRRPEVIEEICTALGSIDGARLVSRLADAEHHRLDTTIVGPPDAVRRAAMAGARVAVERIDMNQHAGAHPRMGAVDVIPFVPLRGITMDEVAELARSFARDLADELGIPVYLYDGAATTPERTSLADVRRGGFEGLRAAVARGERLPDHGPHELGAAGATAVGARKPLVAFNVYLRGDEEDAKAIAKAIRESGGGLPALRAIGFAVPERGGVTVSMNLVDFEVTGLRAAFDAVAAGARERHMEMLSSEIVGLVPEAALGDDVTYLRLEGFDADTQILERLVSDGIGNETIEGFLADLASDSPAPGGGAVAGLCAAAGAALISMVCRLTIGREGYEDVDARMGGYLEEADAARAAFLELADRDARAFGSVMEAFKLPKDDDRQKAERSAAIQRAYEGAARVPLEIAQRSVAMMQYARLSIELGNPQAASDGLSAALALHAAALAAIANVAINAASLKDVATAGGLRDEADALRGRVEDLLSSAQVAFASAVS
ncbi:MAG TPA: glutamate formimidoyltransferase, partial [Actinomycetota bacterium]|nr:glutamate formimidoyltransferase [Actinomycetota bacterium]